MEYWYLNDFGDAQFDRAGVEIVDFVTNQPVHTDLITGFSTFCWTFRQYSLPGVAVGKIIALRFFFEDHAHGNVSRGFYVDDVRVID